MFFNRMIFQLMIIFRDKQYFLYYIQLLRLKMLSSNYYQAPNHQGALFQQLGLSSNPSETNETKITIEMNDKPKKDMYLDEPSDEEQEKYNQGITSTHKEKEEKYIQQIPKQSNNKKNIKTVRRGGGKRGKQPIKKEGKKQQIQINIETNEIAQWGQKGTKNEGEDDSFESDIEEEEFAQKTADDTEIRKKIEEKIKKYENPSEKRKQGNALSSLKNKAEELKRKNQENEKIKFEDSAQNLKKPVAKIEKIKEQSEQQSQDQGQDPWDKINQQTLAKKQKRENASKQMTIESVLAYYLQLNSPQKHQLRDELERQKPKPSFWQTLCGCLKPKKRALTDIHIDIISISLIKLSNTQEQIFLLKEIWTQITNKRYLRFGQHWNEIGFQGRDPATDLRSSGVLSLIQWNFFVKEHPQQAIRYHNFCKQFEIPLALTHIKLTSLIVSLMRKSMLEGRTWTHFQDWYNALTIYAFEKLLVDAKNLQQIGEVVEKIIESTKKNISIAKANYHTEYKKN